METPRKPIDSTPCWARVPYFTAIMGLGLLCGLSAVSDVAKRLVPALSDRLEVEANSGLRADFVAAMLGLGDAGEQRLMDLWLRLGVDPSVSGLNADVYKSIFQGLKDHGEPAAALVADRFRDARTTDDARFEIIKFLGQMGPTADGLPLVEDLLDSCVVAQYFQESNRGRARVTAVAALWDIGPRGFEILEAHKKDLLEDYASWISTKVQELKQQSPDKELRPEMKKLLAAFGLSKADSTAGH